MPTEAYTELAKFYKDPPILGNIEEHRKRAAEEAVNDKRVWHVVIGHNYVRVDYSLFGFYEKMLKEKKRGDTNIDK